MSRKNYAIFIFCLMSAMLFSGCGKSDNDDASDKLKEKMPTESVQTEAEIETKTENIESEADESNTTDVGSDETDTPKGVPNLLLFRDNAFEWRKR